MKTEALTSPYRVRSPLKHLAARLLAALLFAAAPGSCAAGSNPVTSAAADVGYMASSPFRMDRSAAYLTLGVLGTGALLYSFNNQIRGGARKLRSSSLDGYSKVAEKFGNGAYDLAFLGVLGGAGCLFKSERLETTVKLSLESFLAAESFGVAAKYAVGLSRPYTNLGDADFKPFSFKSANASFPSGHTTAAFSIASVFAAQYDSFWVSFVSYGLASTVALQRVYADKHWASDVFFGAALGTITGRTVVRLARKRDFKALTVSPYIPFRTAGIGLQARFVF